MSKYFITEVCDDSLVLRFTRPEIRNPLSLAVLDELWELFDRVGDSDTKRLIFTGQDGVFASGADLREIVSVNGDDARGFAERGQELMVAIAAMPMTIVAAINGFCFGGALDLTLACNYRIASPTATFCHPGVGLGIITGWGGTQRLPRLIGEANALEMFLTATPIDASRALKIGLIDKIDEDPLAAAKSEELRKKKN
ncbi:MAG: enoyl-CoA hydratase/isomerase family protein [Blastocatellia bacterium]